MSPPPTEDASTNASSGNATPARHMHVAVSLGAVRSELDRQKLDDIELQNVESRGPALSERD